MEEPELRDSEGKLLGRFKNRDTIVTTCGDVFDRSGLYIGQILSTGHIMMKEEAGSLTEIRHPLTTVCIRPLK